MKVSNKILVGFFGFIFLYMIAAFTELRLRGDYYHINDDEAIVETLPISNTTYLRIEDLRIRISIGSAENPRIEIRSREGELLPMFNSEQRGDTLIIKEFEADQDILYRIDVLLPQTEFSGIGIIKSFVTFSNLDLPALTINQSGGHVVFEDNVTLEKLEINSRNAHFDCKESKIDTVSVQLNGSNLYLRSGINRLEGSIMNNSQLVLYGSGEIVLKKDDTSIISWVQ